MCVCVCACVWLGENKVQPSSFSADTCLNSLWSRAVVAWSYRSLDKLQHKQFCLLNILFVCFLWRSSTFWGAVMISRNFKNVLVVSVGFLFLFTAYGGLQSLQVGRKGLLIYYCCYDFLSLKKTLKWTTECCGDKRDLFVVDLWRKNYLQVH